MQQRDLLDLALKHDPDWIVAKTVSLRIRLVISKAINMGPTRLANIRQLELLYMYYKEEDSE